MKKNLNIAYLNGANIGKKVINVVETINNQDKDINITENGSVEVVADNGYTGLGKVTVNVEVVSSGGGSGSGDSGDCINTNAYLIIYSYFEDTDGIYERYEAHINIETKEVKYFKPSKIIDTMYVSYTQIDKETYLAFAPNFLNSYLSNITDTDIILKFVKEYSVEISFGKLYINEITENPYIEYSNIVSHSGSFEGDNVEIINNTPILRYNRNAQISLTDDIINKRFASIKYSNGEVINLYAEL